MTLGFPASVSASKVSSITLGLRPSARSSSTSRTHSPSVMPSLSATVASLSYSLSVILQPTVRVRGWSAAIGKGLRGQVDSLLREQENQQVNGQRPSSGEERSRAPQFL